MNSGSSPPIITAESAIDGLPLPWISRTDDQQVLDIAWTQQSFFDIFLTIET